MPLAGRWIFLAGGFFIGVTMGRDWQFGQAETEAFKDVAWSWAPNFYQSYIEAKCGPNPVEPNGILTAQILRPRTAKDQALELATSALAENISYKDWPLVAYVIRSGDLSAAEKVKHLFSLRGSYVMVRMIYKEYKGRLAEYRLSEFLK